MEEELEVSGYNNDSFVTGKSATIIFDTSGFERDVFIEVKLMVEVFVISVFEDSSLSKDEFTVNVVVKSEFEYTSLFEDNSLLEDEFTVTEVIGLVFEVNTFVGFELALIVAVVEYSSLVAERLKEVLVKSGFIGDTFFDGSKASDFEIVDNSLSEYELTVILVVKSGFKVDSPEEFEFKVFVVVAKYSSLVDDWLNAIAVAVVVSETEDDKIVGNTSKVSGFENDLLVVEELTNVVEVKSEFEDSEFVEVDVEVKSIFDSTSLAGDKSSIVVRVKSGFR